MECIVLKSTTDIFMALWVPLISLRRRLSAGPLITTTSMQIIVVILFGLWAVLSNVLCAPIEMNFEKLNANGSQYSQLCEWGGVCKQYKQCSVMATNRPYTRCVINGQIFSFYCQILSTWYVCTHSCLLCMVLWPPTHATLQSPNK